MPFCDGQTLTVLLVVVLVYVLSHADHMSDKSPCKRGGMDDVFLLFLLALGLTVLIENVVVR